MGPFFRNALKIWPQKAPFVGQIWALAGNGSLAERILRPCVGREEHWRLGGPHAGFALNLTHFALRLIHFTFNLTHFDLRTKRVCHRHCTTLECGTANR